MSALGATRGTTQIAQELREQIANKKKTLAATKPIGARVDGCRAWAARCKARRDQALEAFRLASAALEKADEELAQSTRELAVLEEELARVQHGPAAETPAAVATELARCMNKTLGDMKRFHNIPTRSCERNGDINEDPRGGCGPPGDVFFSASWGREGAGGEQKQAVEVGAKAADTATTGSGRRKTSAHDDIVGIDRANRRVAGYGWCHGVGIANLCVQRGQHGKRRSPVQVNEFKTPSAELGSKETTIQVPRHGARENEFMARSGSHYFSVAAGVLGSNVTPFQGPCRRARKNEFVARSASHRFRVATAIVRTLCDKEKSTADTGSGALSGRAALLEIEMARCGLVGIQECRTQTDQIIEGAEYTMVVAGADPRGNYGTQLWV